MPIKVKVKTIAFTDEDGQLTDADYTIRTSLSHNGTRAYMKAITASEDLMGMAEEMKQPGFKPKVGIDTISGMERVLLEDALIDLRGVQDATGKEIKTWQEFLHFEEHYVSQVVKTLMEIAASAVKKANPDPNASAPSVAP